MKIDFSGLNVVVTGGTGALGTAVVRLLRESGAVCYVPVRGCPDGGADSSGKEKGLVTVFGVDVSAEDQVIEFYGKVPGIWASIHCAGGFAMNGISETSLEAFESQWRLNTVSCFLCCRETVRAIRRQRGGSRGRIVNVAARPAIEPRGGAGMVAYTASKAAVAALSLSLGEELAGEGILVNAVAPSILDTPANRRAMPEANFGRWPKVEDVAASIAFLASPQNRTTRSSVVAVYGAS